MPELPEVETISSMLKTQVLGSRIINVRVKRRDLRWAIQTNFESNCSNALISDVFRRGKYIIIKLDHGYIIWHLGMSGTIKLQTQDSLKKHDHVMISLSNEKFLVYNDPRRFGSLFWAEDYKLHPRIKDLGLEPLCPNTKSEALYGLIKNKKTNIKNVIMNANLIVGVGNIYANEALFLTGLNPMLAANSIPYDLIDELLKNIRLVLKKAILAGGTTLNDYSNLDGKPGYFQQDLKVYGREGKPCCICKQILIRLQTFVRQTVYCPKCQANLLELEN